MRAGLGPMLDRGRGHIVVVSSGAALRAFPWAAVYGATKAANKGFAEALRHELSGTGVSLSTVFPGEVATELHAEAEQLPDWRDSDGAIGPEEVAAAVLEAVEEDRREVHVPRQVRLLALNDVAPGLAGPAAGRDPRRLGGAPALLSRAQPSRDRRRAASRRSQSAPTRSIQAAASSSGSGRRE